jgi:rare lipoprotein A (peptidoglycan hydrolase)
MKKIVLILLLNACANTLKAQQLLPADTLTINADKLSFTNKDTTWSVTSTSTGIASYYAQRFNGRKTSSGQIFDHNKLTCAHKTLPFGTVLMLTNLRNNNKVKVKVNDRLPPKSKRTVDLTMRAAKELNFVAQGLTKVKIEIIK